jgi:hypothetical protein
MKLEFCRQIFGKPKYQISSKSVQWELPRCPMRTDGRTDMTKLVVSFSNFENARKNVKLSTYRRAQASSCAGG